MNAKEDMLRKISTLHNKVIDIINRKKDIDSINYNF
jgi:hypothetical protein